jgi:hypothetical protein
MPAAQHRVASGVAHFGYRITVKCTAEISFDRIPHLGFCDDEIR